MRKKEVTFKIENHIFYVSFYKKTAYTKLQLYSINSLDSLSNVLMELTMHGWKHNGLFYNIGCYDAVEDIYIDLSMPEDHFKNLNLPLID